jgi:hypothetical protein
MTPDDVAEWLRRDDGRIEDIFGLWVQGKREGRWVGERLIEEGHLVALRAAHPEDDGLDVERLAQEWEASAERIGERAMDGDPAATMATMSTLRSCAEALRAARLRSTP